MSIYEIHEKLNQIEEIQNKYGECVYKNTEASDLNFLENWINKYVLNHSLSSEYLEFVKLANGLEFNGLSIYSVNPKDEHNIYESNETLWENDNQKQFLFFADDSLSWFCQNINNKKYYILDKPSGTLMKCYDSFYGMLYSAFESIL